MSSLVYPVFFIIGAVASPGQLLIAVTMLAAPALMARLGTGVTLHWPNPVRTSLSAHCSRGRNLQSAGPSPIRLGAGRYRRWECSVWRWTWP